MDTDNVTVAENVILSNTEGVFADSLPNVAIYRNRFGVLPQGLITAQMTNVRGIKVAAPLHNNSYVARIADNFISWCRESAISVSGGGAHVISGNTINPPEDPFVRRRTCNF